MKKRLVRCCVTGEKVECPTLKNGGAGLPRGWSKLGDDWYSPEGFSRTFAPRSMTVPVDRVVFGYDAPFPERYDDPVYTENYRAFRGACRSSWRLVMQVQNWLLFRLASFDTAPLVEGRGRNGGPSLLAPKPEYDAKALWNEGRSAFPALASAAYNSAFRKVEADYKRQRFGIRVAGNRSLQSYRDPQPFVLPADAFKMLLDEAGRVLVRILVAGQRFTVRLKCDPVRFGRQLEPLRRAMAGELLSGAASIRDGRDRQTLVGVAVYVPKETFKPSTETFLVRTDPACLYVGEMRGRNVFLLNECQVRRWQAVALGRGGAVEERQEVPDLKSLCDGHADFVQRMGEDRKAERRGGAPYGCVPDETARRRRQHARNVQRHLDGRCDKHRRRMDDALHKIAAVIANHAARRRVRAIVWDDSERSYMPRFPYAALEGLVRQKADVFNIEVVAREVKAEGEGDA